MTLGQVVKKARISKGLTQGQLAEAVKTTRQSISAWEAGRNQPDTHYVAALESVLGLPAGTLLRAVQENPMRAARGAPKPCAGP